MTWRLSLRQQPTLRVDARALQPSALASMSQTQIERVALDHGRDALALAELFSVERIDGHGGSARLQLEGDLSRFDCVGWNLADGELDVRGPVGDLAGAGLAGGVMTIEGSTADLAGCAMRGGRLEVSGSVGDLAASAMPGEIDGMRGGVFVIRGDAGDRLGDRMRRGTIVVCGDAGELLASRMVAGTIALAGRCGAHPAWGMRRGSIVFAGPKPTIAPTFAPVHGGIEVFWQLLARDLARFGAPFVDLKTRRVERHVGDLAVLGKGELLLPV
ncbi:MAG: formylmethanofuran dehydrogenase subunit C [Burkholderiaceae bacterium]